MDPLNIVQAMKAGRAMSFVEPRTIGKVRGFHARVWIAPDTKPVAEAFLHCATVGTGNAGREAANRLVGEAAMALDAATSAHERLDALTRIADLNG